MNLGFGLTGAHRTGKSTLARMVSEKYNIPFIQTQVAGIIKKLGYSANIHYNISTRIKIQHAVLEETVELWDKQQSTFITDRTPLDMVGYMIANATQDELTHEYDIEFQDYVSKCIFLSNQYFSNIIFVPPAIPVIEDEGKANITKTYINHIAYSILGCIELNKKHMPNVKFDILPEQVISLYDRVEFCEHLLGVQ